MHDYTATEHTHHMRHSGDVSTWREAMAFLLFGASVALTILVTLTLGVRP